MPRADRDDDDLAGADVIGTAERLAIDDGPGRCAVELWLPDPEARRGWRRHEVLRDEPPPSPRRPLGFRCRPRSC